MGYGMRFETFKKEANYESKKMSDEIKREMGRVAIEWGLSK